MVDRRLASLFLAFISIVFALVSVGLAVAPKIQVSYAIVLLQMVLGAIGGIALAIFLRSSSSLTRPIRTPPVKVSRRLQPLEYRISKERKTLSAIFDEYAQTRRFEIRDGYNEDSATGLPCTPAVKKFADEVVKLAEDTPEEAYALLEAQKLLEGTFKEKSTTSSRLAKLNANAVIALLALIFGTTINLLSVIFK